MQKFMKTGLTTAASAALAMGLLAAPQAAMADTCAMATNNGQPNNFSFTGMNDNGYNPVTSSTVLAEPTTIVCGRNSTATGTNATANGANTTVGQDGTAIGAGASATGLGSVALGSGSSDGGVAGVVSIGTVGSERRLINLAAGTAGTDAVNLDQLNLVSATANTALSNSATALTAATTAQSNVATALSNSSTALAAATTAQSTATTALSTATAAQTTANTALSNTITLQTSVTTLQSLVSSQTTQINSLFNLVTANQTEARRGIAAAVAMADAPFPSAPGRTSYATNAAIYRGEPAFSLSLTHRLSTDTPFAISFGASYAGGKDTAFRVGVAGEF